MLTKSCFARIKTDGEQDDDGAGVFEAVVATWDLDSVGDQIKRGAFAETLAEWKTSGNPLPVLWSHMSADPEMHIGVVEDAQERDDGLWVRARLDLDAPKAAQVYRLLKQRRVTQFSFAYDVLDGGPTGKADNGVYELRRLKLYEVGPTLIGANQATDLLVVKRHPGIAEEVLRQVSAQFEGKAGRSLSAKNEGHLREAARLLKTVLESNDDDTDEGKTAPPPTDGTPAAGVKKIDEPPQGATAPLRHIPGLELLLMQVEIDSLTNWRTA